MYMLKINFKILLFFILLFQFTYTLGDEIFYSLKKNKVNVRYGPGFNFPVKFIYKKKGFPVKQIDKKENFRRVVDIKNNSGWIHISQLNNINSVIVLKDKILFKKPSFFSKPFAKVEKGRLLFIKKCEKKWCKVKTQNFKGWVYNENLWGKIPVY